MVNKPKMIQTILTFFEQTKKDRVKLMIRKGYAKKGVEYSEELWNEFRKQWLSKVDI